MFGFQFKRFHFFIAIGVAHPNSVLYKEFAAFYLVYGLAAYNPPADGVYCCFFWG